MHRCVEGEIIGWRTAEVRKSRRPCAPYHICLMSFELFVQKRSRLSLGYLLIEKNGLFIFPLSLVSFNSLIFCDANLSQISEDWMFDLIESKNFYYLWR